MMDLGVECAGEGEGECLDEEVRGGGGGVFGRGRLEAIWNSWSSSAGSGDVVEDAAVLPLPLAPSSPSWSGVPGVPGLSPLTAPGTDPPSPLLVRMCLLERTNSSTSDGLACNCGRSPSIYSRARSRASLPFCRKNLTNLGSLEIDTLSTYLLGTSRSRQVWVYCLFFSFQTDTLHT